MKGNTKVKECLSPTRILVITNKYYEDDPRPQREVSALIDAGYSVDVVCLKKPKVAKSKHTRDDRMGVRFYSFQMSRKRGSKLRYILEYILHFCFVTYMSTRLNLKHRYKLIQVFVMPEALVLACILPKLMGAKILMDWEDPMRELYLSIYRKRSNSLLLWAISLFEKSSVKLADHIITPNEGFRKAFVKRDVPENKISIVMNSADDSVFNENCVGSHKVLSRTKFTILFSGTIVPRAGLDVAISALKEVVNMLPNTKMVVVGAGKDNYVRECHDLAEQLGLLDHIEFRGWVKLQELPHIIQEATIGIIPNRATEFTKINFPTRICEYALLKTPMIAPAFSGIMDYLDDKDICFFRPDDHEDLARCVLELLQNPKKRREIAENAYHSCRKLSWSKTKKIYLKVIENLIGEVKE